MDGACAPSHTPRSTRHSILTQWLPPCYYAAPCLQAEEIRFELSNLRCRGVIVPDLDGPEALPPAIMTMLR